MFYSCTHMPSVGVKVP